MLLRSSVALVLFVADQEHCCGVNCEDSADFRRISAEDFARPGLR